MEISGVQRYSFIDYPGHISTVVFTQGCNFSCQYCYNSQLIPQINGLIDEAEVFKFLKQREDMIEGVVISGGEPTIQADLIPFIQKVKKLKFKIKLDTNGSRPEVLRAVLEEGIDYIAMDIKTCLDAQKYQKVCNTNANFLGQVEQSMSLIVASGINYHFRTTLDCDLISEDDKKQLMKHIGDSIHIFQCKK